VLQFTQGKTQIPKNKRLSDSEKALIREGVEMFGHDWTAIRMTYLPDRTPDQIMRWWNFHEKNQDDRKRKSWTEEEDKLLFEAVDMQGPHKWSLIARHIPGRTPVQCSTRWLGALK